MPVAYIGIGSNLGDRASNCLEAIRRMEEAGCRILATSSFIETEPWGLSDQPRFINAVAAIETRRAPGDLLAVLKGIEGEMGRKPSEHWGPRLIDLDILIYDDVVLNSGTLVIPHPHLHERAFVLAPLAEIAPDLVHPALGKTIRELKERYDYDHLRQKQDPD